jgi:hypothetical protein
MVSRKIEAAMDSTGREMRVETLTTRNATREETKVLETKDPGTTTTGEATKIDNKRVGIKASKRATVTEGDISTIMAGTSRTIGVTSPTTTPWASSDTSWKRTENSPARAATDSSGATMNSKGKVGNNMLARQIKIQSGSTINTNR